MNLGENGSVDHCSVYYSICIDTSIREDQLMPELNLLAAGLKQDCESKSFTWDINVEKDYRSK